ncbi:hypothetical protein DFH09DRAFT_1282475 [Mycena vulgaris]|nr:hypothetical protein DFH09DRAFT_1282475 [Mycena vulgaris]
MPLESTATVFDWPPGSNKPAWPVLKMTAKCYFTTESAANTEGFTLGTKPEAPETKCIQRTWLLDKEQWEPVIEEIFRRKAPQQRVREAWALDGQDHGEAAILNREALAGSQDMGVSGSEWGAAIAAFVRSPLLEGRRMVAIGHSAWSGAMISPLQDAPYACFVLIEPTLTTPEVFRPYIAPGMPQVVAAILTRRERWPSRADAHEWMKRRAPWRAWDARVLRLLTEHGLEDMPDGAVALKCDRRHEAHVYPEAAPHFAAVDDIERMCDAVPIHIVWATRSPLSPPVMRAALTDVSAGRTMASVTHLEGGHLASRSHPGVVSTG